MKKWIISIAILSLPLSAAPYLTMNSHPLLFTDGNPTDLNIPEVVPSQQGELHFRGAVSQEFSYAGKAHMDHPRHKRYLTTTPEKPAPFSVSGGVGMETLVAEKELALNLNIQNPHVPGRELGLSLSVNY